MGFACAGIISAIDNNTVHVSFNPYPLRIIFLRWTACHLAIVSLRKEKHQSRLSVDEQLINTLK